MLPIYLPAVPQMCYLIYPPLPYQPTLTSFILFNEQQLGSCSYPFGQIKDSLNNSPQGISVNRKSLQNQQNQPQIPFSNQKREWPQKSQNHKGHNIQLQNRNILPNTINVILSYVRRANKSRPLAQRILKAIRHPNIQQALKKFYAYQSFLKNNATDFISREAIHNLMNYENPECSFFSLKEQHFYNRLFRIIVRRYLHEHYLPGILTSTKMDPVKRKDHLKVHRYLEQVLFDRCGLTEEVQGSCT